MKWFLEFIFICLQKTFDTVDHETLSYNLYGYDAYRNAYVIYVCVCNLRFMGCHAPLEANSEDIYCISHV